MMTRIARTVCKTLLLLGLIEGSARVAEGLRPEVTELTFDYAPYRMLRMSKAPWPLNRDGFRARELETYGNSFLIEFLGGSVCLGVGTNPGKTLPERIEGALHRAGMRKAQVLNLCQGGAPSAQELAIFLEYGLPLAPQVVLSFNGANDLMHPKPVGEDDGPNLPYRNREMQAQFNGHSLLNHLALPRVMARLARRGADPGHGLADAVAPEKILRSYIDSLDAVRTLSAAHGALHAVLLQPTLHYRKQWSAEETAMWKRRRPQDGAEISRYVQRLFEGAEAALAEWSARTGAPVFDLTPAFQQSRATIYSDSVHFTGEEGYRTIERELEQQGLIDKIARQYARWEERTLSAASSSWRH